MGVRANGYDVKNTNDSGFIITGSVNTGGYNDIILIKTDAMGNTCTSVNDAGAVQVDTMFFTNSRIYGLGISTISQTAITTITYPTNYYYVYCLTTEIKEQDVSSRNPRSSCYCKTIQIHLIRSQQSNITCPYQALSN